MVESFLTLDDEGVSIGELRGSGVELIASVSQGGHLLWLGSQGAFNALSVTQQRGGQTRELIHLRAAQGFSCLKGEADFKQAWEKAYKFHFNIHGVLQPTWGLYRSEKKLF